MLVDGSPRRLRAYVRCVVLTVLVLHHMSLGKMNATAGLLIGLI